MGCCNRPVWVPPWDAGALTERRKKRFELLEQRLAEQAAHEASLANEETENE
jgi:hypothetical protein